MSSLSHSEVINLLLQLAAMLILARLFAEIARKFNQLAVVGELFEGFILWPTILGTFHTELFDYLFMGCQGTKLALEGIVQIAVILLLFIAGLEVELHLIWSQGKAALSISMLGLVIPFALGFV